MPHQIMLVSTVSYTKAEGLIFGVLPHHLT